MKTARNIALAAILTAIPTALSAAFGVIELTASKPQAVQFPSEIAAVTIFSTNTSATASIAITHADAYITSASNTFTTTLIGATISPATTNITFSTPKYLLPGDLISISGVDSTNGSTRAYIFLKQ